MKPVVKSIFMLGMESALELEDAKPMSIELMSMMAWLLRGLKERARKQSVHGQRHGAQGSGGSAVAAWRLKGAFTRRGRLSMLFVRQPRRDVCLKLSTLQVPAEVPVQQPQPRFCSIA